MTNMSGTEYFFVAQFLDYETHDVHKRMRTRHVNGLLSVLKTRQYSSELYSAKSKG